MLAYAAQEPKRAARKDLKAADIAISSVPYTPVPDYPIRPKPHYEVTLLDTFWKPKVARNADVTIPFEFQKLNAGGGSRGLNGGVLEAAILAVQAHQNPALEKDVDARVVSLKKSTYHGNSGFEIAVAYYNATGKRDLLEKAIPAADALYENFKVRKPPFSGGERDALNCVQLYLATHDKKYLDLAKHYLDIRGLADSVGRSRHNQSYKPVLEQSEAVGHAVNCATLMVSLVDVGVLTGLQPYFEAGHRMWQDAVYHKFYITGGIGSTGNEGFGQPYSLPNLSAYAETCAVLMFITLNHKLFLATGDAKYIDVMERGMYNNAIDGVSASGDHFFYVNRLASAGDGRDLRWQHASLECCPPNLVRFLAHMPGYVYAQDKADSIYVNLYLSSSASFKVNGKPVSLEVESQMPWDGKTKITVSAKDDVKAAVKLRIPGWARDQVAPGGLYSYRGKLSRPTQLSLNGRPVPLAIDRAGYVTLDRTWKNGDVIAVDFPMEVRKVAADPKVTQDRRRIAVERGPIVYCAEWPDLSGGHVLDLLVDNQAPLHSSFDETFFGGATVINAQAKRIANPASGSQPVRLIPYHLWANRGAGEMAVWLSVGGYEIGDTGPAGGLIFYENPNYAADGWRYLEAAPFDQSAGAKWGCFRKAIPGARGDAIGTGKQNTKDMLAGCAEPESAAALCANLSLHGVHDWYLPSNGELNLMYKNLKAAGLGDFRDNGQPDNFNYWTSTQSTADMAAHIDFADAGRNHSDDKDYPRRVRAIRTI